MADNILFTVLGFHLLVVCIPVAILLIWWNPRAWQYGFAIFLGLLAAFLDQRTDDPQFTILLVFAFSFFVCFAPGTRPWLAALLIGMWVPLVQCSRVVLEGHGSVFISEGFFSFIALAPALVGAYVAAGMRKFAPVSQQE